ncbi:ATP synthase subunit I [Caballeronia sp. DA-9]|uniref:ATP synthase subunit I n=1 Tax=Caballeronia sp. DA-9 TaxID=3436237 RepID=UPI003F667022
MAVREQDRAPEGGNEGHVSGPAANLTGRAPTSSNSTPVSQGQASHTSNHPFDDSWDAEAKDNNTVPLTRAEAETLFGPEVSRSSRVTPFKVVAAQMVLSLVATLVWWLFYSPPGTAVPGAVALSAFLGGAICWVPSALFAARLKAKSGAETIASWVIGEAMKMGATIAMFVAIAYGFKGVLWIPLLVTYLIALKTYWIAMAWK